MDLLNRAIVAALPLAPRALVGLFARPYIAGDDLDAAMRKVEALAAAGCRATVDVLGEEVRTPEEAEAYTEQYLDALTALRDRDLPGNVSVKPSALGLRIDETLCRANVERIVARAESLGSFVRLDMEDATTTTATLDLYRSLRQRHEDVGVVLQARLRRTPADVEAMRALAAPVRVVKGIYLETPEVALTDAEEIRDAFAHAVERLLTGGSKVAIATHDEVLIERALEVIRAHEISRERYEFQMLLGVRRSLREALVAAGHPMRVYVPFGRDWYAYSMRRLGENPQVAGHVLRNMITLGRA